MRTPRLALDIHPLGRRCGPRSPRGLAFAKGSFPNPVIRRRDTRRATEPCRGSGWARGAENDVPDLGSAKPAHALLHRRNPERPSASVPTHAVPVGSHSHPGERRQPATSVLRHGHSLNDSLHRLHPLDTGADHRGSAACCCDGEHRRRRITVPVLLSRAASPGPATACLLPSAGYPTQRYVTMRSHWGESERTSPWR